MADSKEKQKNVVQNNQIKQTDKPQKTQNTDKSKLKPVKKLLLLALIIAAFGYFGTHMYYAQKNTGAKNIGDRQNFADLEMKISALEAQIQLLKEQNTTDNQFFEKLLANKLAAFKQDLQQNTESEQNNKKIAQNSEKILNLENKIAALEGSALANNRQEQKTQEILLASGAMIIRDMAQTGEDFLYESEVLQILAQGNEIAEKYAEQIKQYAASGIKGKQMLINSFNVLYAAMSEHKEPAKLQSNGIELAWYDKLLAKIKSLVTFRKNPVANTSFAAQKDEVYMAVNEGNLAFAVKQIKILPKYAQLSSTSLKEWEEQVATYLQFEKAVSGLIMNSLAQIRLKEMEK